MDFSVKFIIVVSSLRAIITQVEFSAISLILINSDPRMNLKFELPILSSIIRLF